MSHQLYRHFDAHGQLLYVGISLSACNRLLQHRRRAPWFGLVSTITVVHFATRKEAAAAEEAAIRVEQPLCNVRRFERAKREPTKVLNPIYRGSIPRQKVAEVLRKIKVPTFDDLCRAVNVVADRVEAGRK